MSNNEYKMADGMTIKQRREYDELRMKLKEYNNMGILKQGEPTIYYVDFESKQLIGKAPLHEYLCDTCGTTYHDMKHMHTEDFCKNCAVDAHNYIHDLFDEHDTE